MASRIGDVYAPRSVPLSLGGSSPSRQGFSAGRFGGGGDDPHDRYSFGGEIGQAGILQGGQGLDYGLGGGGGGGSSQRTIKTALAYDPPASNAQALQLLRDAQRPLRDDQRLPHQDQALEALNDDDWQPLREEPAHEELRAGMKRHRCTDTLCLMIFMAALIPFGLIYRYAMKTGDLNRLYHGYDFLGNLCGGPGSATEGKAYVFFCRDASNGNALDLAHPICRERCPMGDDTHSTCFLGAFRGPVFGREYATGSFKQTTSYLQGVLDDYPTSPFAGKYCLPSDPVLLDQMEDALGLEGAVQMASKVSDVYRAWHVLVIAAVLAVVAGYLYLLLLRYMAGCVLHVFLWVIDIITFSVGVYLLISSWLGGLDGVPSFGDSQVDLWLGIATIVMSVVFIALTCFAEDAITMASGCVEAACHCMGDMPTLLLEPALALTSKWLLLSGLAYGFAMLVSCAEVQPMTLQEYAVTSGHDDRAAFRRKFHFSDFQLQCMVYYVLVSFWLFEVLSALTQFVIAYSVQLWYFSPMGPRGRDAPCCPLMRGCRIALLYHLGSLAYGALLVSSMRGLRAFLGFFARQADMEGNNLGLCCARCCSCCLECFENCVLSVNKTAYMELAVSSSDFCLSARRARRVMLAPANRFTVLVLAGACWVFQAAGVGIITAVCTGLTFLLIKHSPYLSEPSASTYVEDPLLTTAVASVVCCIIAMAFGIVFDMVADTLLYCYATEHSRDKLSTSGGYGHHVPEELQRAISAAAHRHEVRADGHPHHMMASVF